MHPRSSARSRLFVRRWAVAVFAALLAMPFVTTTATATDPIINPPSLPCFVFVGQPGWLLPPTATDDEYSRENGDMSDPGDSTYLSVNVPAPGVLGNDGSGTWHAALYSGPSHAAQFQLNSDGSFHYVPVSGYMGGDSFTYVRYTTGGECSTGATVTIDPTFRLRLQDDAFTAYVDQPLYVGNAGGNIALCVGVGLCGVLNNDINLTHTTYLDFEIPVDAGGNGLLGGTAVPGTRRTQHGVVSITRDGSFTYTPDQGFKGTDAFGYSALPDHDKNTNELDTLYPHKAVVGNVHLSWALVTITVVDPPPPPPGAQGLNDAVSVNEDATTSISSDTLTANDINTSAIVFVQNSFSQAATLRTAHGSVVPHYGFLIAGDPFSEYVTSIDYTPDPDYNGPDSFIYYVASAYNNGWLVTDNTATVVITVNPVPDPPHANTDSGTTAFNAPVTVNVVGNDTDPDGDIDPTTLGPDPDPCFDQLHNPPSCQGDDPSGWAALAHGTWQPHPDGTITYTPAAGFTGTAMYPYQVCDSTALCDQATVSIVVSSVGDDTYTTTEDQPLTVTAPGVLGNDRPGVTATLGTNVQHGTLALQPDGSFVYTPSANFNGTDSFTYTIGTSDVAHVTIHVTAVDDPPALYLNGFCDHSVPNVLCLFNTDNRDITEGQTATLNGSITDPEFDGGTLTIDWGDGTTTSAAYPCSGGSCPFTSTATYSTPAPCIGSCGDPLYFRLTHVYADDPADSSDYFAIRGSAVEANGTTGIASTSARVTNVDPDLAVSPEGCALCIGSYSHLVLNAGDPGSVSGRITDPGTDTGTLTIDWGDGSTPSTVAIGCSSSTSLCPTPSEQGLSCGISISPGLNCGYFSVPHTYSIGGTYTVKLKAVDDDGGSASADATATVSGPVNAAPTITSVDHATFTVGSAGSFTVTTTGAPTALISETGPLPSGVTFSDNGDGTATLAGTPGPGTGGSYPLTITASNGVTPDAQQFFTLTVRTPPSIASADHTTFAVGAAGSFTVTTTGDSPMTVTETGPLPSGVSFTDNGDGTATLAGTPAAGTNGSYPITITASNGVLPNAQQLFTLTVGAGSQAIAFDPLTGRTYGDAPFGVSATATSGLTVTFTAGPSGVCSSGGTNGSTISIVGIGTCSVTAHQAGNSTWLAATDVTQMFAVAQKAITVPVTPASVQYSDPVPNLNVKGTVSGLVGSDTLAGTLTGCTASGLTTSGGMVTSPAGSYPLVGCTGLSNPKYLISYSGALTVTKESATVTYTGPTFASTGSATAATTSVSLTGRLTQQADGHPGDLTKAAAQFLLYRSSNLSHATPDVVVDGAVDRTGSVSGRATNLPTDTYTVVLRIAPANGYFGGPDAPAQTLLVFAPATSARATGTGSLSEPSAAGVVVPVSPTNARGDFAFDVSYARPTSTTPQGLAVYSFHGADRNLYVVTSSSLRALSLNGPHGAFFVGNAVVAAFDSRTGRAVPGIGGTGFTFRVDVFDGGTGGSGDTYAIAVYTSTGALYHRAGTSSSQVHLTGGNVTVRAS